MLSFEKQILYTCSHSESADSELFNFKFLIAKLKINITEFVILLSDFLTAKSTEN